MCWSVVLVFGSSTALSCQRMNMSIWSLLFGLTGAQGESLFCPLRIGGREEGANHPRSRGTKTASLSGLLA